MGVFRKMYERYLCYMSDHDFYMIRSEYFDPRDHHKELGLDSVFTHGRIVEFGCSRPGCNFNVAYRRFSFAKNSGSLTHFFGKDWY